MAGLPCGPYPSAILIKLYKHFWPLPQVCDSHPFHYFVILICCVIDTEINLTIPTCFTVKVDIKLGITVYYSVTHTFSRICGLSGCSSVTGWIISPLGSWCSVCRTVRCSFWSGLGHLPCCCSICACCTKRWFWCWATRYKLCNIL